MSRKLLILLGVLVLLVGLGTFLYLRWTEARKKVNLWTLVPPDAVFIWESNNNKAFYEHLQTTDVWQTIHQARSVQQLEENLAMIDSAAGTDNTLGSFLENKALLASLHVVNNNDFDLVFYLPVNNVNEHRFLRNVNENLERSERFSVETREYQGHQLTDVRNTATGGEVTYISYRNNLVISSTPHLIEEIVRNIERGNLESPAGETSGTHFQAMPDVWANLWVNYRQLPVFLSLFFSEKLHNDLSFLFSLCESGLLELKLEEDRIMLNGFSEPDTVAMAMGAQMRKLSSQPLSLSAFVPARASMAVFFGGEQLRLHTEPKTSLPANPLLDQLGDSLRLQMGNEVAFCLLDTYNPSGLPDKLLFAKVTRPERLRTLLEQAEKQFSPDSPTETYSGKPIRMINSPQLPQRIFGTLFKGFDQTYFHQIGDYVVMAEDLYAMRALLIDISNESVWGKSLAQKEFLEQAQQDANLSIFINTLNSWNLLMKYLDPAHRQEVIQNASLIKRFAKMSLQFSRQENQYYTSLVLRHEFPRGSEGQNIAFGEVASITLESPVITQAYQVLNPKTKSPEAVVQDSAFVLHLISADGKSVWSDSIGSKLVSPVYQVDGGRDLAARYVFATDNQIHSLDRTGNAETNYPFNLADSVQLKHLTVADATSDGGHSFIAADFLGNLYWFNQEGALLDGFQPRSLGQPLAMAPIFLRVGGQPVLITILDNGTVYAFNKYGETYSGFPFSLKAGTRGGYYLRPGATLAKTLVTVATVSGEVVTFNLLGDVVRQEQMMKASRTSRFELVPEQNGRSYILARQEMGKLSLYDPELKPILEKSYVTSAPKDIQFFDFGPGRKLYVVIEKGPQKTYFYNAAGNLLGKKPIQNLFPVFVTANDAANAYHFFRVTGRKVQRVTLEAEE